MEKTPLKVLLFFPPEGLAKNNVVKPVFGIQPLGILYIASALKEWADFPCKIKVIDGYTFAYNQNAIKNAILDFNPHIIGVSTVTIRIYDAQRICSIAKSINPDIISIIGGPHASSSPNDTAQYPDTDIVVIGEGEITFLEICRAVFQGKNWDCIQGIAFSRNNETIINKSRPFIQDLDKIPHPDLNFLPPIKHYNPIAIWGKRGNCSTMITSRGCPYACSYCSVYRIQGGKYRYQSANNIMEQLNKLKVEWNINTVVFKEGTFTLNRERVIELCNQIITSNLRIKWNCNARADELDIEMLKLMKKAGCVCIQIGIEQGNSELIKKYKKVTKEQVINAIKWIHQAEIDAHGFFMIGMPEEDMSTIRETIDFAKSLPLDTANFNIFTPRPGTKIFDDCRKKGLISNEEWDKFDLYQASGWQHPKLTKKQLIKVRKKAFWEFYLRPSIIINRVKHIKSWRDFTNHLKGAASFLLQVKKI